MHVVYIIKHEIVIPRSSAYPTDGKGCYRMVLERNSPKRKSVIDAPPLKRVIGGWVCYSMVSEPRFRR
jgi:hypothetical protein